jgi:hypothetical protein
MASEKLSLPWLDRLFVIGGAIVAVTIAIVSATNGLVQHEAVEVQRREKQSLIDGDQTKRLDRLETIMEKMLESQAATNRTLDKLAAALEKQTIAKQP